MGQAKARGTFAERQSKAIEAAELKQLQRLESRRIVLKRAGKSHRNSALLLAAALVMMSK